MKHWKVVTTGEFDDWFIDQPEAVQIEVSACVYVLKELGPLMKRPRADTLKNSRHPNMKELRIKVSRQVIRVAYAFDPDQKAVLLTAGAKQGKNEQAFYRSLIRKADRLFDEHLARRKER